jgi:MYXO-CTERM domain-containing protein
MRHRTIFGVVATVVFSVAGAARNARACGGCFHEPPQPNQSGTVVTDHKMIFSISPQQTTLYDEIKYSGSPGSFAWVLPIQGQVTVGLSSDVVFAALEQTTGTNILAPILPPCPTTICSCRSALGAGAADASSGGDAGAAVNVISEQTIGPYATVQLQSTDPNALNAWLTANGYAVPADVQPIIAAYVAEGFDFLALKLAPGQGIQAMRPVRVTSPGAGLSLPLRMVAAGTGATVGITLWVIGDGSYEPSNFQSFTISPSELTWDWSINRSNYTTLQVQREASFKNAAWQIESSLAVSPYAIQNIVLRSQNDYTAIPPPDADSGSTASDAGSGQTAAEAQSVDLGVLFPEGNLTMRITRMRSDLSHTALATDLQLQAAADQTVRSNVYQVTQSVNVPQCPVPPPCPCSSGSGGSSGSFGGSSGTFGGSSGSFGGSGGSSGGASGGSSGVISDAGAATEGGAGTSPVGEQPGGMAVAGCACGTSPAQASGTAAPIALAGLVGLALRRGRRKRS